MDLSSHLRFGGLRFRFSLWTDGSVAAVFIFRFLKTLSAQSLLSLHVLFRTFCNMNRALQTVRYSIEQKLCCPSGLALVVFLSVALASPHFLAATNLLYFMDAKKSSLFEKISVLIFYFFARIVSNLTGFLSSNNSEAI